MVSLLILNYWYGGKQVLILYCRYKRYESQLEHTKSTNLEAESDFVAEVGGMNHIEPGSEWERVSKHCDFSAKVGRLNLLVIN